MYPKLGYDQIFALLRRYATFISSYISEQRVNSIFEQEQRPTLHRVGSLKSRIGHVLFLSRFFSVYLWLNVPSFDALQSQLLTF